MALKKILKTDDAQPKSEKIATTELSHDEIARRAFEIWCGKGRQTGGAAENWREAQEQLSAELGFVAQPPRAPQRDARS